MKLRSAYARVAQNKAETLRFRFCRRAFTGCQAATYSYDGQGRLLSVTNALSGKTSYAYNLAGWQTSETDPDNNVTQYGYNAAGERTSETDPLNYTQTFSYDKAGHLTAKTDYNGQQMQYSYNESDWKTGETWLNSQNQTIYQATLTYDNAGRLTAEQDGNSLYNYSYNGSSLLTQTVATYPGVSGSPLATLSYGYDTVGNRTSLSDSLGGSLTYSYNGEHQLTGATLALNGTTGPQLSLTYDSLERLSGITRTDGTADTIASNYSYDNASRLTNLSYTDTTKNATLANYTYGYNADSLVTNYQDANSSLTYGYDKTNQLLSASGTLNGSSYSASWTYDANGNRNMSGYQTGTGNELTNDGTYTYTYDKNGNTLTKTNTATGDQWQYSWDYHNQLTEAVEKTKGGTLENDEKFTYDVEGRLIGVNVNGTQQRWTVFDGANPYLDFNGAGSSVTERYLTNPAPYGTLYARVSGTGTANWYVTDLLGSVRQIVDTSGNSLDAIVYDPWGNIVSESNSSNGDRFKFDGGQYDSIQQAYLFNARWDNPQDGRWESQDPAGLASDANLYRYVLNRPMDFRDATGLCPYCKCTKLTIAHAKKWYTGKAEGRLLVGLYTTYTTEGKGDPNLCKFHRTSKSYAWLTIDGKKESHEDKEPKPDNPTDNTATITVKGDSWTRIDIDRPGAVYNAGWERRMPSGRTVTYRFWVINSDGSKGPDKSWTLEYEVNKNGDVSGGPKEPKKKE